MALVFLGVGPTRTPEVALSDELTVFAAAQISGSYVYTPVMQVERFRRVALQLQIDHAAAAGQLGLLILVSGQVAEPAAGDDSWYAPSVYDGSVNGADLVPTLATGADYTKQPNWGQVLMRPNEIVFPAATNATDKQRPLLGIDVTSARWLQIAYVDKGSGTKLTLGIKAVGAT